MDNTRILLGVSGGIAAYRACDLARELMRAGASVQVVLTPAAAQFVTPLTFVALTGQQALVTESDGDDVYAHLNLTRGIDCFVIAPGSADVLAKLAHGVADTLLTTCYLSCAAPVVIAPAMNVRMWEHPAVQANVETLRQRGHAIVDPDAGELACGDVGAGRLAEVGRIVAAVRAATGAEPMPGPAGQQASPGQQALAGRRVVVTAGGTREYLDPVRYLTNNSTGALGLAVCAALLDAGVEVELIDTAIGVPPAMAERLAARSEVSTAFDLQSALARALPSADALIMLAAVADYGPTRYSPTKRKKDGAAWAIELAQTPDVLASLAPLHRAGQAVIGVSLEDEHWLSRAQGKAAAKGCDAMLAVELTGELPYGERRLHCALVTPEAILAEPAMREKSAAAALISGWLSQWFAADAPVAAASREA